MQVGTVGEHGLAAIRLSEAHVLLAQAAISQQLVKQQARQQAQSPVFGKPERLHLGAAMGRQPAHRFLEFPLVFKRIRQA
jgi:hypothetical protein